MPYAFILSTKSACLQFWEYKGQTLSNYPFHYIVSNKLVKILFTLMPRKDKCQAD